MTEPEPPFPTFVRAGYRKYRVEAWSPLAASDDGGRGKTLHSQLLIRIDRSYSPLEQAEILLHEVTHCALLVAARQEVKDPDEEWHCAALGFSLTQVMRDSPELRAWLAWAWAQET